MGRTDHAALTGEVVDAVDGVAERQRVHVVGESWAALKTTLSYSRNRRWIGTDRLAGNHVIIRTAGMFAMYAHLAPGSVAVARGQPVSVGDVIGRVGHSGNSTAPHLHFQLMDSADAWDAGGVACAFAGYLVRRDGRWQHVHNGIPQRLELVRSASEGRPTDRT